MMLIIAWHEVVLSASDYFDNRGYGCGAVGKIRGGTAADEALMYWVRAIFFALLPGMPCQLF